MNKQTEIIKEALEKPMKELNKFLFEPRQEVKPKKRKIEVYLKNGDSINIVINDNYNIDECLKQLPYTTSIKLETDDKKIKYSILTNNISYIKTEIIEEEREKEKYYNE